MDELRRRKVKLREVEGRLPAVSVDGKKLKRKVVYVYEGDEDGEKTKGNEYLDVYELN